MPCSASRAGEEQMGRAWIRAETASERMRAARRLLFRRITSYASVRALSRPALALPSRGLIASGKGNRQVCTEQSAPADDQANEATGVYRRRGLGGFIE